MHPAMEGQGGSSYHNAHFLSQYLCNEAVETRLGGTSDDFVDFVANIVFQ